MFLFGLIYLELFMELVELDVLRQTQKEGKKKKSLLWELTWKMLDIYIEMIWIVE